MSSSWAIVAIPKEEEYVWDISSEKVPHMTLLFLGEQDESSLPEVQAFFEHAAKTMLRRFGVSVDRRGTLGDDEADVLFIDKTFGINKLDQFRHALLTNDTIKSMYDSTFQYPEWTPHITLGYPETPAHEDERDYHGFHWINFDRIALWTGEYEGPEVILESDEGQGLSMSDKVSEFLEHYGVKGMKWGVRKDRLPSAVVVKPKRGGRLKTSGGKNQPASRDAKSAAKLRQRAKASSTNSLSNDELRRLINRMNMEQQYKNLSNQQKSGGKAFVAKLIKGTASQQAQKTANMYGDQIGEELRKKASK